MENINVKRIKCTTKKMFMYWLTFLKPYHHLRNKEIEALSIFLYYRHMLSKEVSKPELVNKLLFSQDIRKNVMDELGIKSPYVFNNLLTALRNKGVLSKDNTIKEVLIPNFDSKSNSFKLIFNFEIDETKQS